MVVDGERGGGERGGSNRGGSNRGDGGRGGGGSRTTRSTKHKLWSGDVSYTC